jgi:hypothetical protein
MKNVSSVIRLADVVVVVVVVYTHFPKCFGTITNAPLVLITL